ncbi:MAG: hypothetical protein LPK45_05440, partial [Bacteroidota bacterium]|nr:hypothetical protein [Bacteroidota bacterium]MDX5430507.1 hypothetical protein [Bacteroidota bacterium]MDX5469263.1 hypothetical protein [Bacteroidota bacterium]
MAISENPQGLWQPEILRLKKDALRISSILKNSSVKVFDKLYNQLEELLKSRRVKEKLSGEKLDQAILDHLNGISLEEYGVWVYYPWNNHLVHLLDEAEFIEVRTSRNQYKITPEERSILASKKVGVVGLSVGQSVSVTMAMERG